MKAILIILGIMVISLNLQAVTSKKEYQKSFDKGDIKEVVISNQYGQIEVEQKEADQITVSASIAVTAKSGSKADELMEYIDVKDVVNGVFLNLETTIGKDMTFKQLLSGVEIAINYKVIIPKGIKLRLINKEGNVFVDNFSGDLIVDIKSGNFQGGSLKEGELQVNQSDGSLRITDVDKLNGQFKGCDIKIDNANEIKISPDNCTGALESVTRLNISSRGGEWKLGQIESMNGNAGSTKFEIQDIGDELKMDMKYGEINVRNIHFNFSTVEVKGSYTKVGLTFMDGAGYNLELRYNKALKRMDLPRSLKLTEQPTSEKNVIVKTGFVGDKKYNGKVLVDIRSGNLYIQ